MKTLREAKSDFVDPPLEHCLALLAAIDCYPDWYPEVIREIRALEYDDHGRPRKADARLRVALGPLAHELELVVAIAVTPPGVVRISRLANEPSDPERFELTWRLERGERTSVELELEATLSVPRLLPLGGVGGAIAAGFLQAAKRALDEGRL